MEGLEIVHNGEAESLADLREEVLYLVGNWGGRDRRDLVLGLFYLN